MGKFDWLNEGFSSTAVKEKPISKPVAKPAQAQPQVQLQQNVQSDFDAQLDAGIFKNRLKPSIKAEQVIPPSKSATIKNFYRKKVQPMVKSLFGQELGEPKKVGSAWEVAKTEFQRGGLPREAGLNWSKTWFDGRDDDEHAFISEKLIYDKYEKIPHVTPTWEQAPLKNLLGAGAKALPYMLDSALSGMATAGALLPVAGAYTASQAAQGPLALTPADDLAVLAGTMELGFTAGVIKYGMDVEGGLIYGEMRHKDIPKNIAQPLAMAGGAAIGAIEVLSLSHLVGKYPVLKFLGPKAIKHPAVHKAINRGIKQYLKIWGAEASEEGIQKIVENATLIIGDYLAGNLKGTGPGGRLTHADIAGRLTQDALKETAQALKATAFITMPAGGGGLAGEVGSTMKLRAEESNRAEILDGGGQKTALQGDFMKAMDKTRFNLHEKIEPRLKTKSYQYAPSVGFIDKKTGRPVALEKLSQEEKDLTFIEENLGDVVALSDKYKVEIIKDGDGKLGEFNRKQVKNIVDGKPPRTEPTLRGERPQYQYNMYKKGDKASTQVSLDPIDDNQRIKARDTLVDFLEDNKDKFPTFAKLPGPIAESLIRLISPMLEKGANVPDIAPTIAKYLDEGVKNVAVVIGGDPNRKGGTKFLLWMGVDKKPHIAHEFPDLMLAYGILPKDMHYLAERAGERDMASETESLIQHLINKKGIKFPDPAAAEAQYTVVDVVEGAVIDEEAPLPEPPKPVVVDIGPEGLGKGPVGFDQVTLDRLHKHPARTKGFATAVEAEILHYFQQLRTAAKNWDIPGKNIGERVRGQKKIYEIVDLAERLYYEGKVTNAVNMSEKALGYIHERSDLQHGPEYFRDKLEEVKPTVKAGKLDFTSTYPPVIKNPKASAELLDKYRRMAEKVDKPEKAIRVMIRNQEWKDGTTMFNLDPRGKKAFRAAGVKRSNGTIYVQQKTLDKYWNVYNKGFTGFKHFRLEGKSRSRRFGESGWLLQRLPRGISKSQFFQFAVEHERAHLNTGLDGTEMDEMMASIIALEKAGRADLAYELEKSIIPYDSDNKVQSIPTRPSKSKFKFTGVDFIDKYIAKKGTQSPSSIVQEIDTETENFAKQQTLSSEPIVLDEKGESIGLAVFDIAQAYFNDLGININLDSTDVMSSVQKVMDLLTDEQQAFLREKLAVANRIISAQKRSAGRKGSAQRIWEYIGDKGILGMREIDLNQAEISKLKAKELADEYYAQLRSVDGRIRLAEKEIKKLYKNLENGKYVDRKKAQIEGFKKKQLAYLDNKKVVKAYYEKAVNDFKKQAAKDHKDHIDDAMKRFNPENLKKLDEALGGQPRPNFKGTKPININESSSGAKHQSVSTMMRMHLAAMKIFGVEDLEKREMLIRFYGKDRIAGWEWPKPSKMWQLHLKSKAINYMQAIKRSVTLHTTVGGAIQNDIQGQIWDYVDTLFPVTPSKFPGIGRKSTFKGKRTSMAADKTFKAYDWLLLKHSEELVGKNVPGQFYASNIGLGGKHETQEEAATFVAGMTEMHRRLDLPITAQDVSNWAAGRDQFAYGKLVPASLKDTVIDFKNDIQNPGLEAGLESGALDGSRIYSLHQEGYTKRIVAKPLHQRSSKEFTGNIGELRVPERNYRTYDEFWVKTKAEIAVEGETSDSLQPSESFSTVAGSYAETMGRLIDQHNLVERLMKLDSGVVYEGKPLNMVSYEHEISDNAAEANAIFTKLGYVQLKSEQGLAVWHKGSFQAPYVHRNVFDLFKSLPRDVRTPGWMKAILRYARTAKRLIMITPMKYMFQMASTPWAHLGLKQAWNHGIKPFVPGWFKGVNAKATPIIRGFRDIRNTVLRQHDPLEHFKDNDYEAKKMYHMLKHGIPSFSMDWALMSLYQKSVDTQHPNQRPIFDNLAEVVSSKFGMDNAAFNHYLPKIIYELCSTFYDRFMEEGWAEDTAARRATMLVGDLTGLLNSSVYGHEGPLLACVLFARDFTMSFFRQLTGAAYPLWYMGHGYRAIDGNPSFLPKLARAGGSMMNSLLHGEKSATDMAAMTGIYAEHLARVAGTRTVFNNLIQFALWQAFGPEDTKEEDKWAFLNNGMGKFWIKTPWKSSVTGGFFFLDVLMWREFPQIVGIIHDKFRYFRGKLNVPVNNILGWVTARDAMDNKVLWDIKTVGVVNYMKDLMTMVTQGVLPTEFKKDWHVPGHMAKTWQGRLAQGIGLFGANVKLGPGQEEGMSPELNEARRRDKEEIDYYNNKIMMYLRAHPKEIDKYLESGKITYDQALWLKKKAAAPVSVPLLRDINTIIEGTQKHGIESRTLKILREGR